MKSLQNYFDNHAMIMRNKTQKAFGDKARAVRRVLKLK